MKTTGYINTLVEEAEVTLENARAAVIKSLDPRGMKLVHIPTGLAGAQNQWFEMEPPISRGKYGEVFNVMAVEPPRMRTEARRLVTKCMFRRRGQSDRDVADATTSEFVAQSVAYDALSVAHDSKKITNVFVPRPVGISKHRILMDRVFGTTLYAYLNRLEKFPLPSGITFEPNAIRIIDVLENAFDRHFRELFSVCKMHHRDLHENNIMVGRNNAMRILDFGMVEMDVPELICVGVRQYPETFHPNPKQLNGILVAMKRQVALMEMMRVSGPEIATESARRDGPLRMLRTLGVDDL